MFRSLALKAFKPRAPRPVFRPAFRPAFRNQWNRSNWSRRPRISKNGSPEEVALFLLGMCIGVLLVPISQAVEKEREEDPEEALKKAIARRDLSKLRRAINRLEPDTNSIYGGSLLHTCIRLGWYGAVELLLERRYAFTQRSDAHEPILVFAVATVRASCSIVELICKRRPDLINEEDSCGKTALQYALDSGRTSVVRILMKYGARQ